jgi:hypothetical protein
VTYWTLTFAFLTGVGVGCAFVLGAFLHNPLWAAMNLVSAGVWACLAVRSFARR